MARAAKRGGGTGTRPYLFFVAFALALSLANYRLASRLVDDFGGTRISAPAKRDTRRYAYSPLKRERYNFTVAICAIVKDGEGENSTRFGGDLDGLDAPLTLHCENSVLD